MAKDITASDLEEKLSTLSQNFYEALRIIAEKRSKLHLGSLTSLSDNSSAKSHARSDRMKAKKLESKTFSVCLESSLGVKLAKSRGTADELEEKLQETKTAFEDKEKTIERMKAELDRRESVLVGSILQIEAYLRAVFYLKEETDSMFRKLYLSSEKRNAIIKRLEQDLNFCKARKESTSKAINALQPAELFLKRMVADMPNYSSITDLVEYYLVLETFQNDLLNLEAECVREEENAAAERQSVEEYKREIPMKIVSMESKLLDLKLKLRNQMNEISQLEEQIDSTSSNKAKDDAAWYDIQKWVKKLFLASVEIQPPREDDSLRDDPTSDTLAMLDRIKDLTKDAFEIVDRLKKERT